MDKQLEILIVSLLIIGLVWFMGQFTEDDSVIDIIVRMLFWIFSLLVVVGNIVWLAVRLLS